MNRKRWLEIGMAALLLCGAYWLSGEGARLASETFGQKETVIVVDAGHGGHRMRRRGKICGVAGA